ncbi:methyltransferase [Nonomuraea sp. NPDC003560]|uniref:methyltransferase n=1 Tax=Nonomuraea sp. NPDC003560 TaxID=3364341 RepID=UPI0036CFDB3E
MIFEIFMSRELEVRLETWAERVYPPSLIGRTFAEEVVRRSAQGLRILDVGCGSGLIGIVASLCGADVTCVDIDPAAVQNTIYNAGLNDTEIEAWESNAFEAVGDRKFDLIAANCPHPDLDLFTRVVSEGAEHLEVGGSLLVWTTSAFSIEECEALIYGTWDCVEIVRELKYDFHKIGAVSPEVSAAIPALLEQGRLEKYGSRHVAVARWYVLRRI